MISVHVPKCGGTSFRLTLEDIFGVEKLQTWYQDRWLIDKITLSENSSVLHGHIHLSDIEKLFKEDSQFEEVRIISWIRNPIDRIISEYYYLMSVLEEQLRPYVHETPTLKKRLAKSLEEFALFPGNVNVMSQFLSRDLICKEQFFFIGEVENFQMDIELFAKKIGAHPLDHVHSVNSTINKQLVDEHTRSILAEINSADIELYEFIRNRKATINEKPWANNSH